MRDYIPILLTLIGTISFIIRGYSESVDNYFIKKNLFNFLKYLNMFRKIYWLSISIILLLLSLNKLTILYRLGD